MPVELSADQLDLSGIIRPGDHVVVGQGCAEPQVLLERLVEQRASFDGLDLLLGPVFSRTLDPRHADYFRFRSYGAMGMCRELYRAGVLDVHPCHMSQVPKLFRLGAWRCDVVLIQLSSENRHGQFSFATGHDYLHDAARMARVVIAEVNDQAPWTYGGEIALESMNIDYIVRTSRPLLQLKPAVIGDLERRIAEHADQYIPDGATIEAGIGSVPDAILASLHGRRNLGVHSGLMTDGFVDLIQAGSVTNMHKSIDRGFCAAGVLFGTDKLYQFAHQNPVVRLQPVTHTHDIHVMASIDNFIAINSAIEVDLSGQINAETIGHDYVGGVGGQMDFIRGAARSNGGRSIVALPSTSQSNQVSRIVPSISGSTVTTPRADADIFVTEWGAAELRGQSIRERMRRMIGIAHPDFREALERSAFQMTKV